MEPSKPDNCTQAAGLSWVAAQPTPEKRAQLLCLAKDVWLQHNVQRLAASGTVPDHSDPEALRESLWEALVAATWERAAAWERVPTELDVAAMVLDRLLGDDEEEAEADSQTVSEEQPAAAAAYIFRRKQILQDLKAAMDNASSPEEREAQFRKLVADFFESAVDMPLVSSEGAAARQLQAAQQELSVSLSSLAAKYGYSHVLEESIMKRGSDMGGPGSGLGNGPLDSITCANSTPCLQGGTSHRGTLCEKRGTLVCARCHLVKYCCKSCQKDHYAMHKADCRSRYAEDAWLVGSKYNDCGGDNETGMSSFDPEFHSMAIHFPLSLPHSCTACLAACGDLSDIVATILSIPDEYTGEIVLHLNHEVPSVAFCNLLTLLGMGMLGELCCDLVTQLWYSVALTSEQMVCIGKMFGDLVNSCSGEPRKEPLSVRLPQLPDVSLKVDLEAQHWYRCIADMEKSMNSRDMEKCMDSRRKYMLSQQGREHAVKMLKSLSPYQRVSWDNFAQLGMLLPLGALNAHHNAQNPYLFDVDNDKWRPTSQLDPLQCWSKSEVIARGTAHGVPRNDIYGALFFLVHDKLLHCIQKLQRHPIQISVTSCNPEAFINHLRDARIPFDFISGVTNVKCDADEDEDLSALVPQAPSEEETKRLKYIEARAAMEPPDVLAVCYLARHATNGNGSWIEKGVTSGIPACLAMNGWHLLCQPSHDKAFDALMQLRQAKVALDSEGLLMWGLVMENVHNNAADNDSQAWKCYYRSACLGNPAAMFNIAGILADRGEHEDAVAWWKRAEVHGPSLFELYRCYRDGIGCRQDNLKACKYLQQAAEKKYKSACSELGKWYSSGWGNVLRKDPDKELHWFKEAIAAEMCAPHQLIQVYRLRNFLASNTPNWWKFMKSILELMPRDDECDDAISCEALSTFDVSIFAVQGAQEFIQKVCPDCDGDVLDVAAPDLDPELRFLETAEALALTSDEVQSLEQLVKEIEEALLESPLIASVEVCGSYGKNTAVSGCADLDLVATAIKCFESDLYVSLQQHAASLLTDKLKVKIIYKPLAVSFTYRDVEIDIVLASPEIEPISQCFLPPRPRFFRRPSLSVQECAFLRQQSPLFRAVVRLLKCWRACAKDWPHGSKPRSFFLELIALAAVEQLDAAGLTEQGTQNGFVSALEVLLRVITGDLKLYWTHSYPKYAIQFEHYDGPIAIDPLDPSNNVAGSLQIRDWNALTQLAKETLSMINQLNPDLPAVNASSVPRAQSAGPQYTFSCHMLRAEQLIRAGHTEEALESLMDASQVDVNSVPQAQSAGSQYTFSCHMLRAEQLIRAGHMEEALESLMDASHVDASNMKLQSLWFECVNQLCRDDATTQAPRNDAELLSGMKDTAICIEPVLKSALQRDLHHQREISLKFMHSIHRDVAACEQMQVPLSIYLPMYEEEHKTKRARESDDSLPRLAKLFPDPGEDEIYNPYTGLRYTSPFREGFYGTWLALKRLTGKMPSPQQKAMYMTANLQAMLAFDALRLGNDAVGIDRMAASVLSTAQVMSPGDLHAFALAAAKRVQTTSSSEHRLPHSGLSLPIAARLVLVHMHILTAAWPKVREALQPLLNQDDLSNRADVCFHIGTSLGWIQDHDTALLWFQRGRAADPTFRQNLWAVGHTMLHASSTSDADPETESHILKTAEQHLWHYISQGLPEDKKRADALYELVFAAVRRQLQVGGDSSWSKAVRRLKMAIEADEKRMEIYLEASDNGAKQCLLHIATMLDAYLPGGITLDTDRSLFIRTLRKLNKTKLIGRDRQQQLDAMSDSFRSALDRYLNQQATANFWSGSEAESELSGAPINLSVVDEDSIGDRAAETRDCSGL